MHSWVNIVQSRVILGRYLGRGKRWSATKTDEEGIKKKGRRMKHQRLGYRETDTQLNKYGWSKRYERRVHGEGEMMECNNGIQREQRKVKRASRGHFPTVTLPVSMGVVRAGRDSTLW